MLTWECPQESPAERMGEAEGEQCSDAAPTILAQIHGGSGLIVIVCLGQNGQAFYLFHGRSLNVGHVGTA